ncbi:hypothetical protein [Curtobacterium sp. MCBD17_040]|uniref:hypothetical protein n=1 Tax=Curtobacterium sp. MCBD17_040 TaxID=2175674 RepID=UPI000DA88071|nr:hypothetical protein [Curtobacterium sp. MCBD17_040]WIB65531.1 hypothetical protein DEI94_19345 [Curtobacterium sp. MCBD17_040]
MMNLEAPLTTTAEFVLSEVELREVAQAVVAACWDRSEPLGAVADHWAGTITGTTAGTPPLEAVAATIGQPLTAVHTLLEQVRTVARHVHEQETGGLPAPW